MNTKSLQTNKSRTTRRTRLLRRSDRLGAAVVEFAIVGPLLVLLTMGMMEVGRAMMVKQIMVNISREGARLASLQSASTQQVTALVEEQLVASSINGATVVLTPSSIESAASGTKVTVSISVEANKVSWIPNPVFTLNKNITAATSMRRESL